MPELTTQQPGSLIGTLPEKTLPIGSLDQLTLLKLALKDASNLAYSKGMKTGVKTTFEKTGIQPEKVSGGFLSDIMGFVEKQTTAPIEEKFGNISETIKSITDQRAKLKDDARSTITQAVSAGFWNKMDTTQQTDLWSAAGYTGSPIAAKTTSATTKEEELQQDIKDMALQLKRRIRPGQNLDLGDYKKARQAWVELSGRSSKDFDENFSIYLSDIDKRQIKIQ